MTTPAADPDVLIAHDFSLRYGGAERLVATVADEFPQAEFWSLCGREDVAERMGLGGRSHSVLPPWQLLESHFRLLAPIYPALVRARKLPAADVLFSSSYAFAHGFRTVNDAPKVCYCHSPLRFAWTMTEDYSLRWASGTVQARAFERFAATMRSMDRRAAGGVTRYVANSRYVAEQIRSFYGREAEVVHPPVDIDLFRPGDAGHDGYFLLSGRLVEPYKRPTLAVEAFRLLPDRRLLVAGEGPELPRLRSIAPPNVEFLGQLRDRELVEVMQRCAATIFPSRDDFGMIPVETMACGRPVIAYGAGGALETVLPGETGELFDRQDADALAEFISGFDPGSYDPARMREHAETWGAPRFRAAIREIIADVASAAPGQY